MLRTCNHLNVPTVLFISIVLGHLNERRLFGHTTCTISALRSFSARRFRFSSLLFLFSYKSRKTESVTTHKQLSNCQTSNTQRLSTSFCLAFSSLSCNVYRFTSSFSRLASIFFSQEVHRGLSLTSAENLEEQKQNANLVILTIKHTMCPIPMYPHTLCT